MRVPTSHALLDAVRQIREQSAESYARLIGETAGIASLTPPINNQVHLWIDRILGKNRDEELDQELSGALTAMLLVGYTAGRSAAEADEIRRIYSLDTEPNRRLTK